MAETLTGEITLPLLLVDGAIQRSGGLVGDVTLPFVSVEGRVGVCNTLVGRVKLALGMQSRGRIRSKAAIYALTGAVRANGCTIFCFVGPPDRSVEWRVLAGSGWLYPYQDYTDEWGRASCKYEADGFSGMLTIEVRYGA